MLMLNQLNGFNASRKTGIQFVGSKTLDTTSSGISGFTFDITGLTGGIDTEARLNDFLIWGHSASLGADAAMGSTATGLTVTEEADLYSNDSFDANLGVYWAYCDAAPPTSVTCTNGSLSANFGKNAIMLVFRGVHPTTPMDVTRTVATGLNTTVANPPSITPVTPGACIVHFGHGAHGTTNRSYTAGPSGYDYFVTVNNAGTAPSTQRSVMGAGYKLNVPASAQDPGVYTGTNNTNDSWAACTLALRPG